MSDRQLLRRLYGPSPILHVDRAILSAPVRHLFMIGTVWYLASACDRKALKVLEVGSWCGASALSFSQGLRLFGGATGSLTCVDAWEPFIQDTADRGANYAREMDDMLATDLAYEIFRHNMSTLPQGIGRQHIRGRSEEVLPQLREAQYDIVFIDANHVYAAARRDIAESLRLVADGGIICGDDLNLQLHQCDPSHARANADRDLAVDPATGRNYHPGVTLAVAEAFGQVSSWAGFWAVQRRSDLWRSFSLKGMPEVYPEHFPPEAIEKARAHFRDLGEIA